MRNIVSYDPESLGLKQIYEAKPGKESTMDQVLDICNRVYEITTYDKGGWLSQSGSTV